MSRREQNPLNFGQAKHVFDTFYEFECPQWQDFTNETQLDT